MEAVRGEARGLWGAAWIEHPRRFTAHVLAPKLYPFRIPTPCPLTLFTLYILPATAAGDPMGSALIPWSIFPHYLRAREADAQQGASEVRVL